MAYLITQMFLYLLVALLLGVGLGWLIWGNWLMKAANGESPEILKKRLQAETLRADQAEVALATCRESRAALLAQHSTPSNAPAPTGTQPQKRDAPRAGTPDDLTRIKGVGPKLEAMLHGLGIYHFDQIAAWSDAELAWIDSHLEGFYGRATRDAWVPQAKTLSTQTH